MAEEKRPSRTDVHHHFFAPEYLAVMGDMAKRSVVPTPSHAGTPGSFIGTAEVGGPHRPPLAERADAPPRPQRAW
jgi:hypothetical protein